MNKTSPERYALVTGGSSGIGRAIVRECARRKMNVLVVALPGRELEETVEEVRQTCSVKADFLATDLAEKDGPRKVAEWTSGQGYVIDLLVNNAGIAGTAVFTESAPEYSDLRIQLNIRALVMLTGMLLPGMLQLDGAYILNMGSLSAFYPIGYKSVYAATKAFVLSFSLALDEELRGTGVRSCVVCPNGVRTNTGTNKRIDSHGWKGRAAEVTADEIAKIALDGLFRGRKVIIPGAFNRFLYAFSKLFPLALRTRIATREMKKEVGAGI